VYFARINQNRWLTDCQSCGSAAIVSPTDPRFACTECQWGWCSLVFPSDVAAVEAGLMGLKPGVRNWWNPDDPSWDRPPAPAEPEPEGMELANALASAVLAGTPPTSLASVAEEASR
jgi:hypothetical protein